MAADQPGITGPTPRDWAATLEAATQAAVAGGKLAKARIRDDFESWDKAGGEPVSEIDHAVNDLIKAGLMAAQPDYGWLSEESVDTPARLDFETLWVVDPIDGTRAYLKGQPEYCVSIACVHRGRPVVAALYDPSAEQLYTAIAGQGAFCNGAALCASDCRQPRGSRLIMDDELAYHRLWPQPWAPASVVKPNSMALRIAWVATGAHDVTMALSAKSDWDIAAADLLLHEAGGLLTDHQGAMLTYNQPSTSNPFLVATAAGVHAQTCTLVRGLMANYQATQKA